MPSTVTGMPSAGSPVQRRFWVLPKTSPGRWTAGLTALIFPVAWVLMTHAIPWPILDTAFAPILLTLLIDAAAVVGLFAVMKRRERSSLTILSLVVALPLALFSTFMILAHAIFPEA